MFGLYTRRQLNEVVGETIRLERTIADQEQEKAREALRHAQKTIFRLQAQVSTYAATLEAQDKTVRIHVERIAHLEQRIANLKDTKNNWAIDRKEALDQIAELEKERRELRHERAVLTLRYADLFVRLNSTDADTVNLRQAAAKRLFETVWASRRLYQGAVHDLRAILEDNR